MRRANIRLCSSDSFSVASSHGFLPGCQGRRRRMRIAWLRIMCGIRRPKRLVLQRVPSDSGLNRLWGLRCWKASIRMLQCRLGVIPPRNIQHSFDLVGLGIDYFPPWICTGSSSISPPDDLVCSLELLRCVTQRNQTYSFRPRRLVCTLRKRRGGSSWMH